MNDILKTPPCWLIIASISSSLSIVPSSLPWSIGGDPTKLNWAWVGNIRCQAPQMCDQSPLAWESSELVSWSRPDGCHSGSIDDPRSVENTSSSSLNRLSDMITESWRVYNFSTQFWYSNRWSSQYVMLHYLYRIKIMTMVSAIAAAKITII